MKSVNELNQNLLQKLYQGETHAEPPSISPEKEKLLTETLNRLVSYGLLNDPGAMIDWKNGLADLTEVALITGTRKAKDHSGYLTMGEFRAMCRIPSTHASHKPYKALPHKPMDRDELREKLAKMKSDLGL